MKLRMHENSLFAILLRSPWWMSFAVAAALFGAVRLFVPTVYAVFAAIPFIVIGLVAGWRQLKAPSRSRIAARLEALRAMSWEQFSGEVESAFRRDGYEVRRLKGADADFELVRGAATRLVSCKRWKAARTGTEPLKALHEAGERAGAASSIYIAAGEVTENARKFCSSHGITLIADAELARFLS